MLAIVNILLLFKDGQMRKILTFLFAWILATPSFAADNTVILTPGSGVTMRTQDVGSGVQSPYNILGNTSGTSIYGTAGTSNAAVLSVQGIASGTALPVSLTSTTITGTVAVTQSGTWTNTVTQATAASLNATVVGTGTFVTQSAVTAASGSFASGSLAAGAMVDFLTTRGTKAPGTAAANSLLTGCVYTAAGVTLTDGQQAACQFTSTGAVSVNVANALASVANNADAVAASASLLNSPVVGYNYVWNGSTWDRLPGTTVGLKVIGAGTAGTANAGVLTVQGIASMTPLLATVTATNLSTNVAQINGVTPLMGNGVTGTGSPRVTIASDGTAISTAGYMSVKIDQTTPGTTNLVSLTAETTKVIGTVRNLGNAGAVFDAATGAAPPANAVYIGSLTSGATGGLVQPFISCDSTAIYDASTNGSTELKALTSGRTVYVCGYSILSAGTVNVKLIYGTGTACATGSNNMTPAYQLTAQVGLVDGSPFSRGLKTASANALCINTSAGVAVQAIVYYAVI